MKVLMKNDVQKLIGRIKADLANGRIVAIGTLVGSTPVTVAVVAPPKTTFLSFLKEVEDIIVTDGAFDDLELIRQVRSEVESRDDENG